MDCNKTVEFVYEWGRMCSAVVDCGDCPLKDLIKDVNYCEDFVFSVKNIEIVIKLVQEWSNNHPVKTLLSALKENYPNVQFDKRDNLPKVCAGVLYDFGCDFSDGGCKECWNTPIEEVKHE